MTGPASTRGVWSRHPGYAMAWTVNMIVAAALGGTAVLCDPARFGAPTYDGLRDSLGITGWGIVFLLYGALLAAAPWSPARATIAVFGLGAIAYLSIALFFALGLDDPRASPWGPIVFGLGFAAWQLTQAEAYRQGLPDRRWQT